MFMTNVMTTAHTLNQDKNHNNYQMIMPRRLVLNVAITKRVKKIRLFPSFSGYKRKWLRHDFMAALIVTAIAIPESLGFAIVVGLPVQAGLY